MDKTYSEIFTKEYLTEQCEQNGKSMYYLSKKHNCSCTCVRWYIVKHGINYIKPIKAKKQCENCGAPIGRRKYCSKKCYGESKAKDVCVNKQQLEHMYINQNMNIRDIANNINASYEKTAEAIRQFHITKEYGFGINFENIDIVGSRVIGYVKNSGGKGKHNKWKLLCDCGNEFVRNSQAIESNKTIKCRTCSFKSKRDTQIVPTSVYTNIVNRAKKSNMKYDISREFIEKLLVTQDYKCALSGVNIVIAPTAKLRQTGHSTASLDRIDSTKGYIKSNVQWVHKTVNFMKMNLKQDEFIDWCKIIINKMEREFKV